MKTLERVNRKKTITIIQGSILSMLLFVSPLQVWSNPDEDGSDISIEEWMTQPFELNCVDYDAKLFIEEWMTQPFEVISEDYDADLRIEEWMTQPFAVTSADYDADLRIEEWMTTAW